MGGVKKDKNRNRERFKKKKPVPCFADSIRICWLAAAAARRRAEMIAGCKITPQSSDNVLPLRLAVSRGEGGVYCRTGYAEGDGASVAAGPS